MQLPGARMQISWIKDFATLRNPRSSLTFLNYLWNVGRLVQFSNMGTFLPTRFEYEAYMKWVAGWFDHLVEYGHECIEISPVETSTEKPVKSFVVKSRNLKTAEIEERRARHVIVSCGGRPNMPSYLPQSNPRIIHSSSYLSSLPDVCPDRERPYRFIVFGSGQSAAEIFNDLQSRYPNCRCTLLIRQAALKPSDDSPFVNETFDPDHVDDVFDTAEDIRGVDLQNDKSTNYGVVRLELLEAIYHNLYLQRIRHSNPQDWPHRILPYREVISVDEAADSLTVQIKNLEPLHRRGKGTSVMESMTADAVIAATGYERNIHQDLLTNAEYLVRNDGGTQKRWQVRRDYSVIFEPRAVSSDAGVWLQGSNESTHGLSDTLLSILSVRAQEVIEGIFGRGRAQNN